MEEKYIAVSTVSHGFTESQDTWEEDIKIYLTFITS